MLLFPFLLALLTVCLDVTNAQGGTVATQCRLVPSAGLCTDTRREFWSYSVKTGGCVGLYGCYSIRDRNVFLTKDGCENACFVTDTKTEMPVIVPGVPGISISLECRLNPSPGQCQPSDVRRYWTYSSKSGSCTQVTGCYSITDRNIWLTKEGCQRGCFILDNNPVTPRPRPTPTLPIIIPKTTTPRSTISIGCMVTPSPGVCRPQDKKTFYSYSSKTGGCEKIFGCYSIRDRNVFLTSEGCRRGCFNSGNNGQDWTMPNQCYVNAQPGQCTRPGRYFTYSSKLSDCTEILGCYGIRDRNVFLTKEGCRRTCLGNGARPVLPDIKPNIKLALECRITPNGGICQENEKKTYWSYSGKTGDCEEIYGCFSVRDRNVFLGREGCRRACFINGDDQVAGMPESQCYIIPSPGRCSQSQRRNFFTYSPKVNRCVRLRGCYSVKDRNVFLSNEGCDRTCSRNSSSVILDPEYAGMDIASGCMLNPSPGRCQANQRRDFYSYSWKAGGCIKLTGCYSVRDRNVFLSRDGCRRNCYIDKSQSGSTQKASECYVTPSPGRCARNQERKYWTFSTKTNGCIEIQGCYNIRDRNVFLMKQGCDRRCAVDTSVTPSPLPDTGLTLARECRVNPSAGVCRENEKRAFFSYSSKTGVCEQIYGCYSVRDRNVFLTREGCRRNCFINSTIPDSGSLDTQCYMSPSPGRCLESQKKSYWTYSTKTSSCGQIYGCYSVRDRNVFLNRESCSRVCDSQMNKTELRPDLTGLELAIPCRVNPAPGQCRESQKRTFYTYSGKTGTCVTIRGCYTLADRNIFLTREGCYNGCFYNRTNPPIGNMNIECYISPVAGRCPDVERQRYYTFSEKTNDCVAIYGCYNIRDRNVFLSRDGCRYNCGLDQPMDSVSRLQIEDTYVTLPVTSGVSAECRMMPSPGQCPDNQKRTYYVFSSKTGTCVSIYGCYSIRDRNVFLNKESCDRRCFTNATDQTAMDAQCFINPSPGRCAPSQRRRFYSYSSKTRRCEEIMGCYSVRDRNVFLSRGGCSRVCAVDPNVTIIPLPDGPGMSVAVECLVNPSVGQCQESQKRTYHSYSGKVGGCLPIYGCYSVQDRNVFLTSEGCTRKCFVNTTEEKPSGRKELQCYTNPSPGRCRENDKRRFWTYSSKTGTCTSLYGCYSIRDRNVFLTKAGCERACAVDGSIPIEPPTDGLTIAIECRMNPSQGICSANQRRSYYSYSSKTGVCEEIYGCYSIRDRNVFLTRDGCRQNCFVNTSMTPSGQKDLQCYLNPSQGSCAQNQVRTFYTYSSKLGRCTTIRGCYSVRDRNVFIGKEGCERACAVDSSTSLPEIPDVPVSAECRISPVAGRCSANQRKLFYSYSGKTRSCVQINGCYSVRDRNVFLSREGCQRKCFMSGGDTGRDIQCYVTPSPGRCAASDRRRYFTFTSKTGNCQPLFGCYSYTDRNVFLTREGCQNVCAYPMPLDGSSGTLTTVATGNIDSGFSVDGGGGVVVDMTTGGNVVDTQTTGGSNMWNTGGTTMSTTVVGLNDKVLVVTDSGAAATVDEGISTLTDLPSFNIGPGIRITRECQLTPTPGICPANRMRTFWTFSSKTNSCTMITGCYDIHDRNTWLTQEGCIRGCLRREGETLEPGVIPLECQLNPTPGRCPLEEENTFWMYNTKLGVCVRITGCYDFHDRNVWSSEQRCQTKCNVGDMGTILPEIQPGIRIDAECKINPPPGRCLDSERKTYWSFSSKTLSCTRIRGCITLRDRNTWLTREGCLRNCLVNESDISGPQVDVPFDCQLVPSPGLCLESQQVQVWTYSNKLGGCVQIKGCYNFHDRNVFMSSEACQKNCHASHFGITLPELNGYRISLECRLNPSPGQCPENMKRSFYSFSAKIGDCVPIYGCYTIKDRNVHFTREGCRRNCLIPTNDGNDGVFPACLAEPNPVPCNGPNGRRNWWKYDRKVGACVRMRGCYKRGDRNVFVSKEKCEENCFRNPNPGDGKPLECRLNPSPGSCQVNEVRNFYSYSSKTSSCTRITGCYSIRDRNVFISRERCQQICEGRSLPQFLAAASNGQSSNMERGRRGRMLPTRNRQPQSNMLDSNIPGVTMMGSQGTNTDGSPISVPIREFQFTDSSNQFSRSRVLTNLF